MFSGFYPDEYRESPFGLDYVSYYKEGFRGIIFDIDNTLVPHGFPATEEVVRYFEMLHGIPFHTCLLSNNREPRVKPFADAVSSFYICEGGKPFAKGYRACMEKMGTTPDNTLFIGDQIFTDVWGAKRLGIRSILVKPIDPHEEIQIVLKRKLEKLVLAEYFRKIARGASGQNAGESLSSDFFRK